MLPNKRNNLELGNVITFYSYKGGVGRSFILANVASQLALWGYRVLCVDWDLEAPGLTDYFLDEIDDSNTFDNLTGVVDLLLECQRHGQLTTDWRLSTIEIPLIHRTLQDLSGSLHLISAGRGAPSAQYIENVHQLNWDLLYGENDFANILDRLKREWQKEYDIIFVDSRTGISDVSGICTVQLPDILALVLTPNKQSLEGIHEVANRAVQNHARFPLSDERLITVPIISRLDQRDETAISESWLARINKTLAPLYDSWLNKEIPVQRIQELSKVPYISRWSFGENLAVLRERGTDSEQISYSFQSLAALLIDGIDNSADFSRGRDEFISRLTRNRNIKQGIEVSDPLAHRLLESRSALAISAYAKELQSSEGSLDDANSLWTKAIQLEPNNPSILREFVDFLKIRIHRLQEEKTTKEGGEKIKIEKLIVQTQETLRLYAPNSTDSITVYISYSHDSEKHREFVLSLSNKLRAEGVDCMIDRYINGFPPEGWERWMRNQILASDFVLVVCTENYLRRFDNLDNENGRGVTFEGMIISKALSENKHSNTKYIPLIPEEGSLEYIPEPLKPYSAYRLPSDYEMLYRILTGQPTYATPKLGSILKL